MKYYALKIRNCRVLLCLLLFSLSFYVHSDGDELVFDPEGEFISTTGRATLSSYAMENHDVSYHDVLKVNANILFQKDADLTNGIKGEVGSGGWIEIKALAYDKSHNKHIIYQARIEEDSPDLYYEGSPLQVEVDGYRSGPDELPHTVHFDGVNIKALLQGVKDSYTLTKSDLEQHFRKVHSYNQYLDQLESRERRGILAAVVGAMIGVGIGVLGVIAGVAISAVTGGAATPVAVFLATAAITCGQLAAGAITGGVLGAVIGGVFVPDSVVDPYHSGGGLASSNYPVAGSIHGVSFSKIKPDDFLVPSGAYPVQVVLEINNAKFRGAKIPGIAELTPRIFEAWTAYSSQEVDRLLSTAAFWSDTPGVLDEEDSEVTAPATVASILDDADIVADESRIVFATNPSPSAGDISKSYFDTSNPGVYEASSTQEASGYVGDHFTMEVIVPIQNGMSFDQTNPEHYPKIEGFPYSWMAYFSGEVLFQCEPSIQPGEWRPWLGYDSQVHGTVMRKYPEGFSPKFYDWNVDTSRSGFVVFRWTGKLTRRMTPDIANYSPVYTWPKQKTSPVQRNNQKEGLNMELLRAWKDHAQATDSTPDFANYGGSRILPGLDPDEFLYLRNSDGAVTDIITLEGEPWKRVPTGEAANPLNDIVTAYKKNRMWNVDGKDYRNYYGEVYASSNYEIQDLGTSISAPDGNGSGNNEASGHVTVRLPSYARGTQEIHMWLNVSAPLETDKGFYGNIVGPEHPSVWEKGLPYMVRGLNGDDDYINNYAVSFTYEDSLGRRKYANFFSEDASGDIHDGIRATGEWGVSLPSMLGYGYYSVNLWHKNDNYTDSWTRISGKEMIDVNLRFMSVPAGLSGVSDSDYPGVALRESPGDGAHIYLDDFLDSRHDDFTSWKFGRYGKNHGRTYVFNAGDISTFEVFDADPHTFVHRGTEWYLSSRTQAKRITDTQLKESLMFYVDPIKSDGKVVEDNRVNRTGKRFTHTWFDSGIYQLKAVYRGVSSVAHRIVVVDNSARQNNRKADIKIRDLTTQEIRWLNNYEVTLGTRSKLLSIDNVDSIYRYFDGPRMHTGNQINRFHPGLDYADGYEWKLGEHGSLVRYDPDSYHSIRGLPDAITTFQGVLNNMTWWPYVFVRHTSEKNSDGQPMPDDIANGSVSVSSFASLSSDQNNQINALFNNVPEPWQVRLPWISFVTDPNPYGDTDNISYRTRTNIKVIYDMNAFFDNDNGAFSGNPVDPANGDYSYQNLKDLGIYLHLMEDDNKLLREFFRNLVTGRMIIIVPPSGSFDAHVSNANDDGVVIADFSSN